MGARAFPAYEAVLADAASNPWDVIGVCEAIGMVRDERRQFIALLVRRLTDPDAMVSPQAARTAGPLDSMRGEVRIAAIYLLGDIGSVRDAEHIRPFLRDNEASVLYAALRSLAKIGGQRDLDALNTWLYNPPPLVRNNVIRKVTEARDALHARLQADPARWKV